MPLMKMWFLKGKVEENTEWPYVLGFLATGTLQKKTPVTLWNFHSHHLGCIYLPGLYAQLNRFLPISILTVCLNLPLKVNYTWYL